MAKPTDKLREHIRLSFFRLLHSFLRHGPEDKERSLAVNQWKNENTLLLRRVFRGFDVELEILGALWKLSEEIKDLPSFDLLSDAIDGMQKNDELREALKEYKKRTDLKAFAPEDLPAVVRTIADAWEQIRFANLLSTSHSMIFSPVEQGEGRKKRKLEGVKDSMSYLMKALGEGILINDAGGNKPLHVQEEISTTRERYLERLARGTLPSGFDEFDFRYTDFVGVLGYTGDGKSTLARFMLYKAAEAGHRCLHVSLENDAEEELDKFCLLHAHNPIFGNRYSHLTFKRFYRGELTPTELDDLDAVAADFKETIGGRIDIYQPQDATWESVRSLIDSAETVEPVDVILVDYLQLLEPGGNEADQRARMTAMIKAVRQYALTEKKVVISPVQSNEDGYNKTKDRDGEWHLSGVNNDKELSRSMNLIIGVFNHGNGDLTLSIPKDRNGDGIGMVMGAKLSPCGYIVTTKTRVGKKAAAEEGAGGAKNKIFDEDAIPTSVEEIAV